MIITLCLCKKMSTLFMDAWWAIKWYSTYDLLYSISTKKNKEKTNKCGKILMITECETGYMGIHCTIFLLLNRSRTKILKYKNEITNHCCEITSKQNFNKKESNNLHKLSAYINRPYIQYGTFKYSIISWFKSTSLKN